MKSKDELSACFKQFNENKLEVTLGTLQDNKGGKYMSKAMKDYCIEHGITRHTVRNTPQQNVSTMVSLRGLLLCLLKLVYLLRSG